MGQPLSGLQRLQGEGAGVGQRGERVRHHRRAGAPQMGESQGEIPPREALLGEHREERKLKQYSTQRTVAFNEEDEVHRRRVHPEAVRLTSDRQKSEK